MPIDIENVPVLQSQMIGEECVAMGVGDPGIIIHYLERDKAMLVTWKDVVDLGLTGITLPDRPTIGEVREIAGPTKK